MTDEPKMKKWQGYFPEALIAEVAAWGRVRGHAKTADAFRVLIRRALDADKPAATPGLPPELVKALNEAIAARGVDDVMRGLTGKASARPAKFGEMIPEQIVPGGQPTPEPVPPKKRGLAAKLAGKIGVF